MTSVSTQSMLTQPAKTVRLSGEVTSSLQGSDLLYEVHYAHKRGWDLGSVAFENQFNPQTKPNRPF